jgi:hypothetical protein
MTVDARNNEPNAKADCHTLEQKVDPHASLRAPRFDHQSSLERATVRNGSGVSVRM